MPVAKLIIAAFHDANARYPGLGVKWTRISHHIGARLPASLLSASIQREGQLDLIIRCMEDELAPEVRGEAEGDFFGFHYMNMLAGYWDRRHLRSLQAFAR
jgi:hypothetical protein